MTRINSQIFISSRPLKSISQVHKNRVNYNQLEKIHSVSPIIEKETSLGMGPVIIPPKSLVITTQGMWSSASNVRPLARYIKKQGHQVYVLSSPYVAWAQRLAKARKWLSEKINNIRIIETQEKIIHIQNQLKNLNNEEKKSMWIKEYFAFDNSSLGKALAKHVIKLLSNESQFIDDIMSLKPDKNKLSHTLEPYQESLRKLLRKTLNDDSKSIIISHKSTNKIFDAIAPRAVVMAHSLGGIAGLQALQAGGTSKNNHHNDISMVIGMGSPFSGAGIPSGFEFLGPFIYPLFYGVYQLIPYKNSPITKIQKTPLPIDTTVIALANPKDGLVSVENNSLNGNVGTLQIKLTPKEANMKSLIADSNRRGFVQWLQEKRMSNYNKLSEMGWSLLQGLRHHCGFLEPKHFDFYYSEQGEIYHHIFESENTTKNLKSLLHPHNHESMQQQILLRLLHKLANNPAQVQNYLPLKAELEELANHSLPFENSSNKLATIALKYLEEECK